MIGSSDVKDRESIEQFESRKTDHIRVAMDPAVQSLGSGFDSLVFAHEALPEIDFDDVSISSAVFSGANLASLSSPFFISSMTAGHAGSLSLNERLARAAELKGWAMGVGSQRRELFDDGAAAEWKRIRAISPKVKFFGNIGLSQLIHTDTSIVRKLSDSLEATAMIVHLNPLQEALQVEGTPRFKGGLSAIAKLVKDLGLPVVVKETGCGISLATARRLVEAGVSAIDVAGRGGTHWGRIEGARASAHAGKAATEKISADSLKQVDDVARAGMLAAAAVTFEDWGLSTVESLRQVVRATKGQSGDGTREINFTRASSADDGTEAWASGGIRSGLDGAKALMLGANAVGVAQPILAAALESEDALHRLMDRFDYELKTVLFCQGVSSIADLKIRGRLAQVGIGSVQFEK